MKNINFRTIFKTVRFGAFLGAVFFVTASTAFASPILGPLSATHITDTSMTITASYSNPYKSTTVWIEVYGKEGGAFALHNSFDQGIFSATFRDLNPGQTYSYRSAAMEGGVTVYSNVASFTTTVPKQGALTNTGAQKDLSNTIEATQKTKGTQTAKKETAGKVVASAPTTTKEGFTNNPSSVKGNSASVIGTESDLVPNTLIGWVLLFIAILLAVLLVKMIFESNEKHRKEDEEDEHGNGQK